MSLNQLGLGGLREDLWADHEEASEEPERRPLLAHYTSIEALESIVKSQELWLSNPRYTNDSEELRWVIEEAWARLYRHPRLLDVCNAIQSAEAHGTLTAGFGMAVDRFVREHLLDTYIFCFSEHEVEERDGRLSMWRGYGANGKGVCAVFDLSGLGDVKESPFVIAPVKYLTTQQRQAWLNSKIEQVASFLESKVAWTKAELLGIAVAFFHRIRSAALFTKHKGFEEEREWRLVFHSDRDEAGKFQSMKSYQLGGSTGIAPKLKLKLPELESILGTSVSFKEVIKAVVIGPTQRGELLRETFVRMLELNRVDLPPSSVHLSSIPYRP